MQGSLNGGDWFLIGPNASAPIMAFWSVRYPATSIRKALVTVLDSYLTKESL